MSAEAGARRFLDSNILIYAFDADAPSAKRQKAQDLLSRAVLEDEFLISPQVIGEFVTTVARKLVAPLELGAVRDIVAQLAQLPSVDIDAALTLRALDTQARYQVSYWDALIIAAAERGGCGAVLTEDLANGQRYWNVAIENPFAEA